MKSIKKYINNQQLRVVNENSKKSEIILLIYAHGGDLKTDLQDVLDDMDIDNLDRKKCLSFTMADKSQMTWVPKETTKNEFNYSSAEMAEYLADSLRNHNYLVSVVLNELTQKFKDNIYNYKDVILQRKQKFDKIKHPENYSFIKTIQSIYNSCEQNYIAQSRVIKNDRLYFLEDPESTMGIITLDIRYPKSAKQNKFASEEKESIQEEYGEDFDEILETKYVIDFRFLENLDENKNIKLSDILKICYQEYDFDYVTIFDFACRDCSRDICDVAKEIETKEELKNGFKLKRKFYKKRLGGKSTKNVKKRKQKRKTIKKN